MDRQPASSEQGRSGPTGRLCAYCSEPIPASVHGHQVTCSTKCRKARTSAYQRSYQRAYREVLQDARNPELTAADREQIAAKHRAYWAADMEQIAAKQRADREAEQERRRARASAYQRDYRATNRDQLNARQRARYAAERLAAQAPRQCAQCSGPIPASVHGHQVTCSDECRKARTRAKRAANRDQINARKRAQYAARRDRDRDR